MPAELHDPVIVDFPLRGEGWVAVTTPARRVPSHGTDMLGQRYAYDFVKVDARPGMRVSPASTLRAAVLGDDARRAYAWNEPIHAPVGGEVVAATDSIAERRWVHPIREIGRMVWNAWTFTPDRLPSILGNHVILRVRDGLYAGFVHLVPGSVAVAVGDRVRTGDVIGTVGHTGNSTSPHLHFQLMDSADLMSAGGVACAFRRYEVLRDGAWVAVANGVPGPRERIRAIEG